MCNGIYKRRTELLLYRYFIVKLEQISKSIVQPVTLILSNLTAILLLKRRFFSFLLLDKNKYSRFCFLVADGVNMLLLY